MDLIDKKLIFELFKDGRASYNELGRDVNISKEVCAYRLKKLFEQNIINKINPIIDYEIIGFSKYRLQIKFQIISKIEKEKFINELKKISQISSINIFQGNWDLSISFLAKNIREFKEIYNKLLFENDELIEDKFLTIITQENILSPNYLFNNSKSSQFVIGENKKNYELSNMDTLILKELILNGRESLTGIANKLNVAINTIKYNLNDLIDKKIILGFIPDLNIIEIGFDNYKINIDLYKYSQVEELKKYLFSNKNITKIIQSYGKSDLEFTCVYEKMEELVNFLDELKNKFKTREIDILFYAKKVHKNWIY